MRYYFTILTVAITLFLAGCVPYHQPHYLDNIPQRAQLISHQTRYLSPQLVALAMTAYNRAQQDGYGDKHILTIVDYSKPSCDHRFWVIDTDTNQILFKELVAHGEGSGELYATHFSDVVNSRMTSLGMYMTAPQSYYGHLGYALRLKGLEPGFNDAAWSRAIVVHGAPYVCPTFIKRHGQAGRSWGCMALDPSQVHQIIDTIKGGSLIFAYANSPDWLNHSRFLH